MRPELPAATNILEAMSEGFLQLDAMHVVTYVNTTAERLLRLDRDEVLESRLWDALPSWCESELPEALERLRPDATLEVELYHPLGQRWLGLRLMAGGGAVNVFFSDITDKVRARQAREKVHVTLQDQLRHHADRLERLNAKLLHDSLHDALTGLPNRTYLMDSLRRAIQKGCRTCSLLFLDFDGFKLINDSLGHTVGDELLIALAKRLRGGLRASELIARLGGDEFTVLLPDTPTPESALALAERLKAQLEQPFRIGEYKLYLTASMGVVHDVATYATPEEVLRDADTAMYHAKAHGKGQCTLFDAKLREEVVTRMRLEADLRQALARQELQIHFQPIIDLAGKRLRGFEALTRWRHPTHGFIPPDTFISVAEDAGLIADLDFWVVREACERLSAWSERQGLREELELSVNFSGRHFARPDLEERLRGVFRDTDFRAERLNIEITETVLMDNTTHTQTTLARLRALGVNLHIDDFGTGYSSLGYLQRFAAGGLKIDRSFTKRLSDLKGAGLVRALIAMAHSLDMKVTAEGVETPEQLERLTALECDYAQGYLIARPSADLDDFAPLVLAESAAA